MRSDAIKDRIGEIFASPRTAPVFDPASYLREYQNFLSGRSADNLFLLHALFLEEWARMFEVEFT
jgi:hypothetical protein